MYFNYHAKVRKMIENGKATYYEILKEYHGISPCMIIYFRDSKPMPIRQHKFDEYRFLLAKFNIKEKTEF
ncbi:MAG: hypothetical protein ACI4R8_02735 [Candidatus Caccovivens sp.]